MPHVTLKKTPPAALLVEECLELNHRDLEGVPEIVREVEHEPLHRLDLTFELSCGHRLQRKAMLTLSLIEWIRGVFRYAYR